MKTPQRLRTTTVKKAENFDLYASVGRFLDEGLLDAEKYYLQHFGEVPGLYYYIGRKDSCNNIVAEALDLDEFRIISEKTVVDRFKSKSTTKIMVGDKSGILLMSTIKDHSLVSAETRAKYPNTYGDHAVNPTIHTNLEVDDSKDEDEDEDGNLNKSARSAPFNFSEWKSGLRGSSPDNANIMSLSLYYRIGSTEFDILSEKIDEITKNAIVEDSKVERKAGCFILYQTQNGIQKKWFENHMQNVDVKLSYSEEVAEGYEFLKEAISPMGKKGLALLTGVPGSGKTTLIKQLSKEVKKDFIFIPSTSAQLLADPSFSGFLLDNPNSVLVIEEAQNVLRNRDKHPSATDAVASLLNITDGLLSDALNIICICTSNSSITDIDPALLRDGRLIAEMQFEYLDADHANKIADHYKIEKQFTSADKKISLASIFCKETYRVTKKDKKKIGF